MPKLLVDWRLEPAGDTAVDLTTERGYAGVSLVDCVVTVRPGGVIAKTAKKEALFLEIALVQEAAAVCTGGGPLPSAGAWTLIERFSSHTAQGVNLLNGVESTGDIAQFKVASQAPDFAAIRRRHYRVLPSFQDPDAVNVKAFGAKGDGITDDTQAFEKAIRAHDKVFHALNVERKGTNPQSEITDSSQVRIFYFKVEAGTVSRENAGDGNTPCRISGSRDVRVYCMYGVVRKLGDRPMLDVVNSHDVTVSQSKILQPDGFPHLTETFGQSHTILPSYRTCALFVRDAKGGSASE